MRDRTGRPPCEAAHPVERCFAVVSGYAQPGPVGVGILIQITPQLRILVAIDVIDGRKYAPSIVMRSRIALTHKPGRLRSPGRRITGGYGLGRSMASNLSGGRK
jgi:hypothetical protein